MTGLMRSSSSSSGLEVNREVLDGRTIPHLDKAALVPILFAASAGFAVATPGRYFSASTIRDPGESQGWAISGGDCLLPSAL